MWIVIIALLLVVPVEEGFANLEVFDFTSGTGSWAEAFDSIVMFWGQNASNRKMINVDSGGDKSWQRKQRASPQNICKKPRSMVRNQTSIKKHQLGCQRETVTSFIGPSGCGKTTLLRCLNRMHEMTPGGKANRISAII